ncbi:hypothetical protein BFJ68_g1385 [Fusarium oxysporum]|uniref:Amidohydrolase-related domain-containing protein n=2 Tax=Fusarium oxysporum TaxID=5507 RepID=A0A420S1S4_FUSOX|nr:hypothetical protein BFJ65_g6019 [Fusarium oxysporum f. sp. cepae]RKK27248.1 hypothetical protein BFJ67_g16229 [Fusarium oxysporum f. sp. cepae]RKK27960.1 hypothetical protein BFJ66_g16410 [Fusarium oxysporum f. sp. cepae]RKL23179.1 hypothetical protein BFJ68_g1385 [Fusarium oxysporum]
MRLAHGFCLVLAGASFGSKVLFDGGTIITFDENAQAVKVLRNTSVLVEDDIISAIYEEATREAPSNDTEVISAVGKIITPGFIDTHRHLFQTGLRTMRSNITMAAYFAALSPYVPNVINRFTADDIYYGQLFGIWQSLEAGVTTIIDHSYGTFDEETSEASLRASIDSQARISWCYGIHRIPNNFTIERQVAYFKRVAKTIDWDSTPVQLGISYDEFDGGLEADIDEVIRLTKEYNVSALTTHFMGGPWIASNSPTLLNRLGLLNLTTPVIFSHATSLSPDDATLLRELNHHIAIAPESEMHFGHGFPHSHNIMDQAGLAIDAGWAWSADLISQARIWLQSVRAKHFQKALDDWKAPANSPVSVNQAFLLATLGGARALRRPDLGVIAVGAKADIVVFDATSRNFLGWTDPVAAVILHSHAGHVEHVMVGGTFRKRDFKLVMPSNTSRALEDATERFLESAQRLQAQFMADPPIIVQGEHKPGVPYIQLEHVDALAGNATGY